VHSADNSRGTSTLSSTTFADQASIEARYFTWFITFIDLPIYGIILINLNQKDFLYPKITKTSKAGLVFLHTEAREHCTQM
ncbi:hypothetical protein KI387_025045, partial [Taxus chinensis]